MANGEFQQPAKASWDVTYEPERCGILGEAEKMVVVSDLGMHTTAYL